MHSDKAKGHFHTFSIWSYDLSDYPLHMARYKSNCKNLTSNQCWIVLWTSAQSPIGTMIAFDLCERTAYKVVISLDSSSLTRCSDVPLPNPRSVSRMEFVARAIDGRERHNGWGRPIYPSGKLKSVDPGERSVNESTGLR